MKVYVDNFVPDDMFNALTTRMLQRFKPGLRQDTGSVQHKNYIPDRKNFEKAAVRIRTSSDNHDYSESKMLLGSMVPDIVVLIKDYMQNVLHIKNPMANTIWFQYQSPSQKVAKHVDGTRIRGCKPENCYNSFLYAHKEWDKHWGGELCFNDIEILTKANRLVIYSREEEHWVNSITHGMNDYQRMFLGIDWSTDNDL